MALSGLHEGAQAINRVGDDLARLGTLDDGVRKGVGILGRIEVAMTNVEPTSQPLEEIKQGLDRATQAIEGLSQSWASSFERSSRAGQEQLAKTLHSLKDALDLLNVSMEQGNALYRSIVKRTFSTYPVVSQDSDAA